MLEEQKQPVKLYLFGSPRLEINGAAVAMGRRKSLALLAYLAMTGRPHNRAALANLLWPQCRHPRNALRQALFALDKRLGKDYLAIGARTVELRCDAPLWVDALAFRRSLADVAGQEAAAAANPAGRLAHRERLSQAVKLHRADFLENFLLPDAPEYDEWQLEQAYSLNRDLVKGLEKLLELYQMDGQYEPAIPYAQRLALLEPLDEPAQQQLIRLYLQTGQPTLALRQYQRFAQCLQEATGASPAKTLDNLVREVEAGQVMAQQAQPAGKATSAEIVGKQRQLPLPSTPFVGREEELRRVVDRLRQPDCRLLTISGPGGVGKTRLAIEAARRFSADFAGDVYFVDLTDIYTGGDLLAAIAESVQLSSSGSEEIKNKLGDYLQSRRLLLLLDNFEQLVDAAHALDELMAAAGQVKWLVTSRHRLKLQGEWLFPLAGLAYKMEEDATEIDADTASYPEALHFFSHCVNRFCPEYALAPADLPYAAEICRQVEGLPLGIELAAAWMRSLSCQEIAETLAQEQAAVTTSWVNAPARHSSLGAVCDYSWKLLSTEERQGMRRLSVFEGGFSQEAAWQVAGVSLPLLMALVDKSLLRRQIVPGQKSRFIMHQVIHAYAAARLKDDEKEMRRAGDRHCDYYLDFLQRQANALERNLSRTAVQTEWGNVRRAWRWAAAHDRLADIDQVLESVYRFHDLKGIFQEGIEDLGLPLSCWQRDLEKGSAAPEKRRLGGRLLIRQGLLYCSLLRPQEAGRKLRQGLDWLQQEAYPPEYDAALALSGLGRVAWHHGDLLEARQYLESSMALFQRLGCRRGLARVLTSLGSLATKAGEYREAVRLHQESLAISQELDNQLGVASALNNLSHVAEMQGDYEQAEAWLQDSLAVSRAASAWWLKAVTLSNLAYIVGLDGRRREAIHYLQASLALREQRGLPGQKDIQRTLRALSAGR